MNRPLVLGGLLLGSIMGTACNGVSSDSFPRATRAPEVRCFNPPAPGSPGQDPHAQPMFFFMCMQSP